MSKCGRKNSKQQWDIQKPKVQAARQKRNIHHTPPDEVVEFRAIIQNARNILEIPVEPAMPCVARVRISIAKAPAQKVAVSKEGRVETPSLERRVTLTDKKGMANKSVRVPKVFSLQTANSFA